MSTASALFRESIFVLHQIAFKFNVLTCVLNLKLHKRDLSINVFGNSEIGALRHVYYYILYLYSLFIVYLYSSSLSLFLLLSTSYEKRNIRSFSVLMQISHFEKFRRARSAELRATIKKMIHLRS